MRYTAEELQHFTTIIRTLPEERKAEARELVKRLDDFARADDALADFVLSVNTKTETTNQERKASDTPNKSAGSPRKPKQATKGNQAVKSTNKTKATQNKAIRTIQEGNNTILERVDGETVETTRGLDIDYIKNRVNECIANYCAINDIEDLMKLPQRPFGALSTYIGENVFKHTGLLKQKELTTDEAIPTNHNAYDPQKVAQALTIYEEVCQRYNKTLLIDYAAQFCGLSDQTLYNMKEKLTALSFDLDKKREQSLAAGIIDGKQSPVGAIAALNHWHNWTTSTAQRVERVESVQVLPVLVNINKNDVKQVDGANVPKLEESQ